MQYDYIIVGAGSGGSSLAGRLADACPDATIALIEAGSHTERNLLVNMPVGIAALVPFKLGTNYGYETVPQPGLGGRRGYQPRGRGMGGSSAINAMIYTRAIRATTTNGRRSARRAGAGRRCCRISAARKATSAAPTHGTARTVRSRFRICASAIRSPNDSCRPRMRPAIR